LAGTTARPARFVKKYASHSPPIAAVTAKSTHEIDDDHLKCKEEAWEGGKRLEILIDLERINLSER